MSRDVVVYSTPFCAPCEALKRYLRERDIDFRVRDLMMDEEAADRLEELRIRSTPALEVDGQIWAGDDLNAERLRNLFG